MSLAMAPCNATKGLIGWMPKVAQPKCWHANFFFAKTWAKILEYHLIICKKYNDQNYITT